jgi:hypothetical protein
VGYINPYETDAEVRRNHGVLSRRQARKDYLVATQEDGFDAAMHRSKSTRFRVPEGFKKIPGASRSGALDPQTRTRVLRSEERGEIELKRDDYGRLIGYRSIDR